MDCRLGPSPSVAVSMQDDANMSPVTQLAHNFYHHCIDSTPRRRLSLDTIESVSDRSNVSLDSQLSPSALPAACRPPSADMMPQWSPSWESGYRLVSGADDAALPAESVSDELCGSDGEELRMLCRALSPAPSVFVDDDSLDSGYSDANSRGCHFADSHTTQHGPTNFTQLRGASGSKPQRSFSIGSTDQRILSNDDGFFDDPMECSLASECTTPAPKQRAASQSRVGGGLCDVTNNSAWTAVARTRKTGLRLIVAGAPPSTQLSRKRQQQTAPPLVLSGPRAPTFKRRKSAVDESDDAAPSLPLMAAVQLSPSDGFPRCHSESEVASPLFGAHGDAIQAGALVGDHSRKHSLPTIDGPCTPISAETLAQVLLCGGRNVPFRVTLVDCRYPYEFNGGHIRGAVNVCDEEQLLERFYSRSALGGGGGGGESVDQRQIIVFHCEYSHQRGPRLWRRMRKEDRRRNVYPRLFYPENYLLDGGYKRFFEQFAELCEPRAYVRMLDSRHRDELRRCKSTGRLGDGGGQPTVRRPGLALQRGLFRD